MKSIFLNLGKQIRQSVSVALLWRMLLVFGIYTVCRLIFYVYNRDLLEISTAESFWRIMQGGLLFDLSALVYTNGLIILLHLLPFRFRYHRVYQWVLAWLFYLINGLSIIVNLADTVYFRFTLRRTTVAVFREFQNEETTGFLHFFLSYWGVSLIGVALIILMVWLYRRIKVSRTSPAIPNLLYYPLGVLILAIGAVLSLIGIRGSFFGDRRPIYPAAGAVYTTKPQQLAMVLNTPFTLVRNLGRRTIEIKEYMPREEALRYFSAEQNPKADSPYSGMFRGRNVVLIIWESFAREWVGKLNQDVPNYTGYTPFIDSLLDHSYYFERAYAGGTKSIDAMPSILTSIPKPKDPFVLSEYSSNALTSIVNEVGGAGYYSAFFHNARNGSMGFDAFTSSIGFRDYFGLDQYGDMSQYDGHWGVWDMPFLQFIAKTLGTFHQPFFVTEFTTTSHEPYQIPKDKIGKYSEGHIPIHKCIGYTDDSLREFFAYSKTQPWYANTLFVITADHAVSGYLDKYKTTEGHYRIPMIFFDPQQQLVGRDSTTIVQQADLMPTILDLLGINNRIVSFGNNMFAPSVPHFAVSVMEDTYQMIMGDYLMLFDGERVLNLYNTILDPKLERDVKEQEPEVVVRMLPVLKAYVQEFTYRMTKNKLVVTPADQSR